MNDIKKKFGYKGTDIANTTDNNRLKEPSQ